MERVENFRARLADTSSSEIAYYLTVFALAILFSSFVTYSISESGSQGDGYSEVLLSGEINDTRNSKELLFFNESLEISMEQGSKTRFYLDIYDGGNAEETLDSLKRDGDVRSGREIFDYPSGVYMLQFTYHIGDDDENHWLKPEKMEKLG